MAARLIRLALIATVLMGCGDERFDIYSPSQIHHTIKPHPNRDGLYVVQYRWDKVIDEFGPGIASVRQAVRQADDKDKLVIWDNTMAAAVPKYLEANGLIPAKCVRGVIVISSNQDEAGNGMTAFRCK